MCVFGIDEHVELVLKPAGQPPCLSSTLLSEAYVVHSSARRAPLTAGALEAKKVRLFFS
jgi:hypothetical protein